MKTLYLDCSSGVSGDMTVAALLDLGADEHALREGLRSLDVPGYEIAVTRVKKSGIDACDFDVLLHPDAPRRHRGLADILSIIEKSAVAPRAKRMAAKIFTVLAEAESKVHGISLEEVHFHEVGAIDSIVDIVGAAICVDALQVERVLCSPLCEGTGSVSCAHGTLPVPVPATLEIARACGVPLVLTDNIGEMVTPTGAAIAASLADSFGPPGQIQVLKTGYGAGKREYKTANLLRAMLIEEQPHALDEVLLLECNLDDMTGEHLAYAAEKLMAAGALDAWYAPVMMKKGRPAQTLSVLCKPADEEPVTALMFLHTSTIGVRVSRLGRHIMERSIREVETPYGSVMVKDASWRSVRKTAVEYESARKISETCKIPIDEVYRAAYNK